MIYCILLNPSLDQIIKIPHFYSGGTFEITDPSYYPVGKAISVALSLNTLEIPTYVVSFVGSNQIKIYKDFLDQHKINCNLIPIAGETRKNITILDEEETKCTHIRYPGFTVTLANLEEINSFLENMITPKDIVVFSGSNPKGTPLEFYFKPSEIIKKAKAKLIIDSSGEHMKLLSMYNPFIIKSNLVEMESILHKNLNSIQFEREKITTEMLYDLLDQCQELEFYKTQVNIITLGRHGAVMFSRDFAFYGVFTDDTALYTVGCGDSFLGGFLAGIQKNLSMEECLKLAIACASANIKTLGAGLLLKKDVDEIYKKVVIKRLK